MNEAIVDPDLLAPSRGLLDAMPGAVGTAVAAFMAVASLAIAAGIVRRRLAGLPVVPEVFYPAATWNGLIVAIVAAAAIACQMAGIMVAQRIDPPTAASVAEPGITATELAAVAFATLAASGIGSLIVLLTGGSLRAVGLFCDEPARDLRLAVGTVLLITPPLLVLSMLLDRVMPYEHPILHLLAKSRDLPTLTAIGLSAVVAAPIGEELFFRGILQGWFESLVARNDPEGRRKHAAVVASALCFAMAHYGQGLGWVPLVGFGLAVGLLRSARGSLLSCVAVHSLFNAISVAIILLG